MADLLWWRHAIGTALLRLFPPAKPGDAPHGVNAEGETDWC